MTEQNSQQPRASWPSDFRFLTADLWDHVRARQDLVKLEIDHDVKTSRRLLLVGGGGLACVLVGLPLLLVAAAYELAQVTVFSAIAWLLILAAVAIGLGTIVAITAVQRFRRDFSGLRHSLSELQEDISWLREWSDSPDQHG